MPITITTTTIIYQVIRGIMDQRTNQCYCCGESDHLVPNCPHKSRPKSKCYMKTGQVFFTSSQSSDNVSVATRNSSRTGSNPLKTTNENISRDTNGWQGYHVQLANILEMKNLISLDNQSTEHVFVIPNWLQISRRQIGHWS